MALNGFLSDIKPIIRQKSRIWCAAVDRNKVMAEKLTMNKCVSGFRHYPPYYSGKKWEFLA